MSFRFTDLPDVWRIAFSSAKWESELSALLKNFWLYKGFPELNFKCEPPPSALNYDSIYKLLLLNTSNSVSLWV